MLAYNYNCVLNTPDSSVVSTVISSDFPDSSVLTSHSLPPALDLPFDESREPTPFPVDQTIRDEFPGHKGKPMKVMVSFKLYISSKNKQKKKIWLPVNSAAEFPLSIIVGITSFDEFQAMVADACHKEFENTREIILDALNDRSHPPIYWFASIPRCEDWKKTDKYELKFEPNYNLWLNTACEVGRKEVGLAIKMPNPAEAVKRAVKQDLLAKRALRKEAIKQSASKKRKAATGNGDGGGPGAPAGDEDPDDEPDGSGSEIDADDFDDLNFHMRKIYAAHLTNSLYDRLNPVYIDPTNPRRYILLTFKTVQDWANDLLERKVGVTVQSPPSSFKYLTVSSSKRMKIESSDGSNVIQDLLTKLLELAGDTRRGTSPAEFPETASPPSEPNIEAYVDFVGVRNRNEVLRILFQHDITRHTTFKSAGVTRRDIIDLGISLGNTTLLFDNATRFDRHLAL